MTAPKRTKRRQYDYVDDVFWVRNDEAKVQRVLRRLVREAVKEATEELRGGAICADGSVPDLIARRLIP